VNVEDVLASLNPKLRKNISLGTEILKTEFAKTPSFGLNRSLNGGLPYGRQVLVWGNKSSGKSSFLLQTIAKAQQEGKVCAWIDAEMSFSPEWAEKLGVDVKSLIVSTARTINDMVDVGTDLMQAGADIIVVDSISALLPAVYFEKDGSELKQLENTKQIGAEAKDMTGAVKMLNYANNRTKPTLLILISQARNNITAM
jgi:recombination protein RecA